MTAEILVANSNESSLGPVFLPNPGEGLSVRIISNVHDNCCRTTLRACPRGLEDRDGVCHTKSRPESPNRTAISTEDHTRIHELIRVTIRLHYASQRRLI